MHHITATLLDLHGPVIYAIVAALVFAEAALFFGFVFPGETAIVVGGVLAAQNRVSLPLLIIIVVIAASAGDSVGYEVGRRFGPRLLSHRAMRRHRRKVGWAQDLIRRRGAFAVFIGRFTALLRALMPALVGSSRMPYPKFLIFNVLGGVVWGAGFTLGGFFLGAAFERTAQFVGRGVAIAIAVILTAALVVWTVRRHRRSADPAVETVDAEDAVTVPES
ncbi:MAG TPA: DedA family protein [Streptosporangiaceae bacterium]|nr:DedA family protein [Streptosporangiaceae bacterium]